MIRLAVRRVRPSEEQRLRDWMGVVNGPRSDEALATLTDEGCTHEVGILVQTSDGPLLVYAMEVEDEERSRQAGLYSRHTIDADHKRVMAAALAEEPELERLLDLRAPSILGSRAERLQTGSATGSARPVGAGARVVDGPGGCWKLSERFRNQPYPGCRVAGSVYESFALRVV